jgi:hypothetical protein
VIRRGVSRTSFAGAPVLIALALGALGQSGAKEFPDGVLAVVGDHVVSTSVYRQQLEAPPAGFRTDTIADRLGLLDFLVNRRILATAALQEFPEARGIADSAELRASYAELWRQVEQTFQPNSSASGADLLQAFREKRVHRWFGRQILTDSQAGAERVLERLNAGESFADLAKEMSIDLGTAAAGGRFAPRRYGDWLPELWALATELAPGEHGGPVATRFGFAFLECDSVVVSPESERYMSDERLREVFHVSNVIARDERWVEDFLSEHDARLVDSGVDLVLTHLFSAASNFLPPHRDPSWTASKEPLGVSKEGDTLTVKGFFDHFAALPASTWPRPKNRHSIASAARRLMAVHIMARRLRAGDLELDDAARARIDNAVAEALGDFYRRRVLDPGDVDSLTAEQVFRDHPEYFELSESASVGAIGVADRAAADSVLSWLSAGVPFEQAAERVKELDATSYYSPATPFFYRGSFPQTDSLIFSMGPGDFTPPIPYGETGFQIYSLVEKRPPRPMRRIEISDEDLRQRARDVLQAVRGAARREELRKHIPVRMNEAAIARTIGVRPEE